MEINVKRKASINNVVAHQAMPTSTQLQLSHVLGASFPSSHSISQSPHHPGLLAYPCGAVIVLFDAQSNIQRRYLRSKDAVSKPFACTAFSRDGTVLAAGEKASSSPEVLLWEVATGRQLAALKGHRCGVSSVVFSADGKLLASSGLAYDGQVCLWDCGSNVLLARLTTQAQVSSLTFTEDGASIVAAGKDYLKVLSISFPGGRSRSAMGGGAALTPRPASLRDFKGAHFVSICSAAPSAVKAVGAPAIGTAGAVYVLTSDGMLLLMRSTGRSIDKQTNLQVTAAYSLAVSSAMVACACANGIVRLYLPNSLVPLGSLPRLSRVCAALDSPSSKAASAAGAAANVFFGSPTKAKAGPPAAAATVNVAVGDVFPDALSCAFNASGECLAVQYSDRSLAVWDVRNSKQIVQLRKLPSHPAGIWDAVIIPAWQAAFLPHPASTDSNTVLATSSADGCIRLWDILDGYGAAANGVAASRTSLSLRAILVASAADGIATGAVAAGPPQANNAERFSLQRRCSPDSPVAAAAHTSQTGAAATGSLPPGVMLRSMAVSPDGRHLAAGDQQGNLRVYDLQSMQLSLFREAHDGEVLTVAYSPLSASGGCLLASGSRDMLVHVFDMQRGYELVETCEEHTGAVTALRFAPCGRKLISCGADRTLVFRHITCRPCGHTLELQVYHKEVVPRGALYDLAIGSSGRLAVTVGQDGLIRSWDVASGKLLKALPTQQEGFTGDVTRMTLDASGTLAFCAASDGSLCTYDLVSDALLARGRGHADMSTSALLLHSCAEVVSLGGDGAAMVWKLPPALALRAQQAALATAPAVTAQVAAAAAARAHGDATVVASAAVSKHAAMAALAGGARLCSPRNAACSAPGAVAGAAVVTPAHRAAPADALGISATIQRIQAGQPLISTEKLPKWAQQRTLQAQQAVETASVKPASGSNTPRSMAAALHSSPLRALQAARKESSPLRPPQLSAKHVLPSANSSANAQENREPDQRTNALTSLLKSVTPAAPAAAAAGAASAGYQAPGAACAVAAVASASANAAMAVEAAPQQQPERCASPEACVSSPVVSGSRHRLAAIHSMFDAPGSAGNTHAGGIAEDDVACCGLELAEEGSSQNVFNSACGLGGSEYGLQPPGPSESPPHSPVPRRSSPSKVTAAAAAAALHTVVVAAAADSLTISDGGDLESCSSFDSLTSGGASNYVASKLANQLPAPGVEGLEGLSAQLDVSCDLFRRHFDSLDQSSRCATPLSAQHVNAACPDLRRQSLSYKYRQSRGTGMASAGIPDDSCAYAADLPSTPPPPLPQHPAAAGDPSHPLAGTPYLSRVVAAAAYEDDAGGIVSAMRGPSTNAAQLRPAQGTGAAPVTPLVEKTDHQLSRLQQLKERLQNTVRKNAGLTSDVQGAAHPRDTDQDQRLAAVAQASTAVERAVELPAASKSAAGAASASLLSVCANNTPQQQDAIRSSKALAPHFVTLPDVSNLSRDPQQLMQQLCTVAAATARHQRAKIAANAQASADASPTAAAAEAALAVRTYVQAGAAAGPTPSSLPVAHASSEAPVMTSMLHCTPGVQATHCGTPMFAGSIPAASAPPSSLHSSPVQTASCAATLHCQVASPGQVYNPALLLTTAAAPPPQSECSPSSSAAAVQVATAAGSSGTATTALAQSSVASLELQFLSNPIFNSTPIDSPAGGMPWMVAHPDRGVTPTAADDCNAGCIASSTAGAHNAVPVPLAMLSPLMPAVLQFGAPTSHAHRGSSSSAAGATDPVLMAASEHAHASSAAHNSTLTSTPSAADVVLQGTFSHDCYEEPCGMMQPHGEALCSSSAAAAISKTAPKDGGSATAASFVGGFLRKGLLALPSIRHKAALPPSGNAVTAAVEAVQGTTAMQHVSVTAVAPPLDSVASSTQSIDTHQRGSLHNTTTPSTLCTHDAASPDGSSGRPSPSQLSVGLHAAQSSTLCRAPAEYLAALAQLHASIKEVSGCLRELQVPVGGWVDEDAANQAADLRAQFTSGVQVALGQLLQATVAIS